MNAVLSKSLDWIITLAILGGFIYLVYSKLKKKRPDLAEKISSIIPKKENQNQILTPKEKVEISNSNEKRRKI